MNLELSTLTVPPDFLTVGDLGEAQFAAALDLAEAMKHAPAGWLDALPAETLACFFEKPSTRTRVSFAAAAHRLGMLPLVLRPDELQLGRGETVADTARTLAGFCAAIVIRTFAQATVEELAAHSNVPVINALTDDHHPCQALADFLTLREVFGHLEGLKLAYIGDSDNVARSLMEAGALSGVEVVVASPPAYQAEAAARRELLDFVARHHGHAGVVEDPHEAVAGAHAVYTDVWVSMGAEADAERRRRELAPYQVTAGLMAAARPDAVFMHCLPAHRGEEMTAEVIDGPASVVWQQAANRLPTEQAIVHALITGGWSRP
ncbi:MAG TPA: ornithine carbamoyltransferase [Gaiellales bacterium]